MHAIRLEDLVVLMGAKVLLSLSKLSYLILFANMIPTNQIGHVLIVLFSILLVEFVVQYVVHKEMQKNTQQIHLLVVIKMKMER